MLFKARLILVFIILCNPKWLLVCQIINNSKLIIDKTILLDTENLKQNIKQNNLPDYLTKNTKISNM